MVTRPTFHAAIQATTPMSHQTHTGGLKVPLASSARGHESLDEAGPDVGGAVQALLSDVLGLGESLPAACSVLVRKGQRDRQVGRLTSRGSDSGSATSTCPTDCRISGTTASVGPEAGGIRDAVRGDDIGSHARIVQTTPEIGGAAQKLVQRR